MKKLEHFTDSVMNKRNTTAVNERNKEDGGRCNRGTVW